MTSLPKLTACSIDLTEACTLACDYCFTFSEHKPKSLSFEMGKAILDWFLPRTVDEPDNTINIQFWGGEPLVEWELLQKLVLYGEEINKEYKRNIEWGGTTNGMLLTPEKVQWGLEHNCFFMMSIDGIKEVHDAHRKTKSGKGSFDICIKNFKEAQKIFPRMRLRASITVDGVPHFFESIKYFVEELNVRDIMFSPVFEDEWTEEVFSKLEEQFQLVIEYAVQQAVDGKHLTMKHLDEEAKINCTEREPGNPCGAGNGYVGFSVDGFIFPCHRFNKHGITTQERAGLETVIGKPTLEYDGTVTGFEWINEEWRQKFINFRNEHKEKCLGCDLLKVSVCNGGCPAVNYDASGNIHEPPKSECIYNRIQHMVGLEYRRLLKIGGLPVSKMGGKKESCFCNNMCYSEGPGKVLDMQKRMLDLCKRILQTHDQEKTDEQRAKEIEVIDKTVRIL